MAAGSFRRFSASSTAGGREAREDRELKATAWAGKAGPAELLQGEPSSENGQGIHGARRTMQRPEWMTM